MLPCHAYLSVVGGELVGKVLGVDLWFGQGLDQDIHRPVLCHFAKAVFPPIVHHLEKFCVFSLCHDPSFSCGFQKGHLDPSQRAPQDAQQSVSSGRRPSSPLSHGWVRCLCTPGQGGSQPPPGSSSWVLTVLTENFSVTFCQCFQYFIVWSSHELEKYISPMFCAAESASLSALDNLYLKLCSGDKSLMNLCNSY